MKNIINVSFVTLIFLSVFACKDSEVLGEDPYAGGKESFGVQFKSDLPSPERASAGDVVTFKVDGLKQWEKEVRFFLNNEATEIISLTDSTVQIKVPDLVSSGGASVLIGEQTFYGPQLVIEGKVKIDPNTSFEPGFNLMQGEESFRPVVMNHFRQSNSLYFVGSFSDYNSNSSSEEPINAIVRTGLNGAIEKDFRPEGQGFGPSATISTISRTSSGSFIVSGKFGRYAHRTYVENIARINANGKLEKEIIKVINPTPEEEDRNSDTIPSFNASLRDGTVSKHFMQEVDGEERIVAIGTFLGYYRYRYDAAARPTYDFKNRDQTEIKYLVRLRPDGQLDSTFNFDLSTGKGKEGPNGHINNGIIHGNKIYLVGSFTSHNGQSVGRIMRLDDEGGVDLTFDTGTGANDNIVSITEKNGKLMLAGSFTSFNGQPFAGVVRLNLDGSIDETFKFKEFTGGIPTFAAELNTGQILVGGSFDKYDKIQRGGMLILDSEGNAEQDYNSLGGFSGQIMDIIEAQSSLGKYQLTLVGNLTKLGTKKLRGIVSLEFD